MKRTLVVAALLLSPVIVLSQGERQSSAELQRMRGEIAQLKRNLAAVQSRAQGVEQEMQAIDLQVALKTRQLELAQATRDKLEEEKRSTVVAIERLKKSAGDERQILSSRLRQLQRFGGLNYFRAVLSLESETNPFAAISMLTYLASRDARDIRRFQLSQKQLATRQHDLVTKHRAFAAAVQLVSHEQRQLADARARRQLILVRLDQESRHSSARIVELEEKARRLEQLLKLLYERGTTAPGKVRIADYKGALAWPVIGPVIEEFGRHRSEKFATYTVNNGVKISVPENSVVRAVFPGTVLFSQWFKGYGNLIIIDHGDRVFSLYGNTRIGVVKVGDQILGGQAIATVNHDEEGSGGYLYFEVRENNKPVNPKSWLR